MSSSTIVRYFASQKFRVTPDIVRYFASGHYGVVYFALNIYNWGEPERAPQFGGSSSSSAMHYGAFVRCTYVHGTFSTVI